MATKNKTKKNYNKGRTAIYWFINTLITLLTMVVAIIFSKIIYESHKFFVVESIFYIVLILAVSLVSVLAMNTKDYNANKLKVNFFRVLSVIICGLLMFGISKKDEYFLPKAVANNVAEIKNNNFSSKNSISFVKYKQGKFTNLKDYNIETQQMVRIGYVEGLNDEDMNYAIDSLPKTVNYKLFKYKDFTPLVKDLYNNKLDLMLLNEIYRDAIKTVKNNFDTETEVTHQTKEIGRTKEKLSNSKHLTQTTSIAFIGSFEDGEIEMNAQNNIVMLMTICPETRQILLANLPTNTIGYVGFEDNEELLKYTGRYGSNGFIDSMANILHVDASNYFKFNMKSIELLMNKLGKIDVELSKSVRAGKYKFSKGNNEMTGDEVIALLKSEENNENAFEYQQAVMKGIIEKMFTKKVALNIRGDLEDILGHNERMVEDELWYDLIHLQYLDDIKWDIKEYNIEGTASDERIYSKGARKMVDTVELSEAEIESYLNKISKMISKEKIS